MSHDAPINGLLESNGCFGCGLEHPTGLRIRIFRDPASSTRLVGEWKPRGEMSGFPEIVHGGLQYTALDCMAGWAAWVLSAPPHHMVLTAKGSMRYLKPATLSMALKLSADVVRAPASPRDTVGIVARITDDAGTVLSEAEFDYAAVPADRFLKAVGITELPAHYRAWFARQA